MPSSSDTEESRGLQRRLSLLPVGKTLLTEGCEKDPVDAFLGPTTEGDTPEGELGETGVETGLGGALGLLNGENPQRFFSLLALVAAAGVFPLTDADMPIDGMQLVPEIDSFPKKVKLGTGVHLPFL